MAQVVKPASRLPCREMRRTLTGLTAGVLSHSTIYRLVGRATQHARTMEKQAWYAWFEAGAELPSQGRCTSGMVVTEPSGVRAPWAGRPATALALLVQARLRPGDQAKKALATVRRQADTGGDWRGLVDRVPPGPGA
jgi:hypothetical protein